MAPMGSRIQRWSLERAQRRAIAATALLRQSFQWSRARASSVEST